MKRVLVLLAVLLCAATGVAASDSPRWEKQGDTWVAHTLYFDVTVDHDPVDNPAIDETIDFLDQVAIDILESLQHEVDLKMSICLLAGAPPTSPPYETGTGRIRIFDSRKRSCPQLVETISSAYVWNVIADLKANAAGWAGWVTARHYSVKYRNLVADSETIFDFHSSLKWPLMVDGKPQRGTWAVVVDDHTKWLREGDQRVGQTTSLLSAIGDFLAQTYGEQCFASMLNGVKDGTAPNSEPAQVLGKSQPELEDEFYRWLDSEMGNR